MDGFPESASTPLEASSEQGGCYGQPDDLVYPDLVYPLVTVIAMLLLLGSLWVF